MGHLYNNTLIEIGMDNMDVVDSISTDFTVNILVKNTIICEVTDISTLYSK